MAGKNPREAVTNYLSPLSKVVSCLTESVLSVSGGYYPAADPHALLMAEGRAVRIDGSQYAVRAIQHYRIVEEPGPRGPWRGAPRLISTRWRNRGRKR